jgi:hypothetical protein
MATILVSQLYFYHTGVVAPSGATITPNINSANGSRSISGSGTIKIGGTIGGSGAKASTNMWGPLPVFNPVVKKFHELQQNYQGVKIEKLQSL